jgi:hypothetical protein
MAGIFNNTNFRQCSTVACWLNILTIFNIFGEYSTMNGNLKFLKIKKGESSEGRAWVCNALDTRKTNYKILKQNIRCPTENACSFG